MHHPPAYSGYLGTDDSLIFTKYHPLQNWVSEGQSSFLSSAAFVLGVSQSVSPGGVGVPLGTGVLFLAQTTQREKPS
jgi:hypothetical protein